MHNVTKAEVQRSADRTMIGKLPAHPMKEDPRMDAAELLSRCKAAARMQLAGKVWSFDDREDCASHILAETLHRINGDNAAETPVGAAELASFRRLTNLASDWRRSEIALRNRAERDAVEKALHAVDAPPADAALIRSDGLSSEDAHAAARLMLDALGLPRLGKAYPLAYGAAREYMAREAQTDENGVDTGTRVTVARVTDADRIAAELNLSPAAYRKARSAERIARNVPSVTYRGADEHGAALGLEVPASPARKASATRTSAAELGKDVDLKGMRDRLPKSEHAPVTCRKGTPRDYSAPSWTSTLPRSTQHRLQTAATMRAERAAKRDAAASAALRAAAGLPTEVPS